MTVREHLGEAATSIIAVLAGILVGALILWLTGCSPLRAYGALLEGAFGDYYAVIDTLTAMMPIMFAGAAAALMFRAALFFIGMEGQLYIGAVTSFLAGYLLHLPAGLHVIIAFIAGGLGGLLWGLLPGYLRAKYGVNETVMSIMMNWIAIFLTDYIVQYAFADPTASIARTYKIHATALIPKISSSLPLSWGFVVAVVFTVLTGFLLYNTSWGFEIRAVGLNPRAARVARISVESTYLKVFLISGFLAGLAGASMVLGVFGSIVHRFSPGYGWDGITAALIARNNPYMVIPASLLLATLRTGSIGMMLGAGVSNEMVLAIQGVILVAAAAPEAYSLLARYIKRIRGGTQ